MDPAAPPPGLAPEDRDPRARAEMSLARLPADLRLLILEYVAGLHTDTRGLPLSLARLRDLSSLLRSCKAIAAAAERSTVFWAALLERALPASMRNTLRCATPPGAVPSSDVFTSRVALTPGRSPRLVFAEAMRVATAFYKVRAEYFHRRVHWHQTVGPWEDRFEAHIVLHTTDEEFVVAVVGTAAARPQVLVAPDAALSSVPLSLLRHIDLVRSAADVDAKRPVCLHHSVLLRSPRDYGDITQWKVAAVGASSDLFAALAANRVAHPLQGWQLTLANKMRPNGPYVVTPSFCEELSPNSFYAPAHQIGFYKIESGLGDQLERSIGALLMFTMAPLPPSPGGEGEMTHCFVRMYVTACLGVDLFLCNERSLAAAAAKWDKKTDP